MNDTKDNPMPCRGCTESCSNYPECGSKLWTQEELPCDKLKPSNSH